MKKVLQTISISEDLNEAVRVLAFHFKQSKEETLSYLLTRGLETQRDLLNEKAPGLLPRHINRKRKDRVLGADPSQLYKYYLTPHMEESLNKYVEFDESHEITVWNIYFADDTYCDLQGQDGSTDLAGYEQTEIGRILELHKQVKAKKFDYDPYILWSEDQKKRHLP